MKILLFGMARSRSSYLSDILANHYNYENYYEPYHRQLVEVINKKFDTHKRKEKWEAYVKAANGVTNKLKNKDNFVVKLFPDALYDFFKFEDNSIPRFYYWDIKKSDCLPILEHYNIQMYDVMYATYRTNKIDNVCSFLSAARHDQFLFVSEQRAKFYAPKKIKLSYNPIQIEHLAFNDYFYYLNLEIVKKHYPNIICLDYDEIPNYVNNNFPNVKSKFIDTKYDYKNNIVNYDEIADDYMKARKKIEESCASLLS